MCCVKVTARYFGDDCRDNRVADIGTFAWVRLTFDALYAPEADSIACVAFRDDLHRWRIAAHPEHIWTDVLIEAES